MSKENQPCINPIEDQRAEALRHYEEVSSKAHHWSSFVEAAIKAYIPASQFTQPTIEQEGKSKDWLECKIEEIMDSLEVDSDMSIMGRYQAIPRIIAAMHSYASQSGKIQPHTDKQECFVSGKKYWVEVPVSELPKDIGVIWAIDKNRNIAPFYWSGNTMSAILLREQYTYWLSPANKQEEANKWVRVEDGLPPLGKEVNCYCPKSSKKVTALCRFSRYEGATTFYWDNFYGGSFVHVQDAVTHWQPLPQPPVK